MKRRLPPGPDDLKYCNCCRCGLELLGPDAVNVELWCQVVRQGMPVKVAGRIGGRPYCEACLAPRQVPNRPATLDDIGPWQENAIRDMEDGGGSD